MEIIIWNVGSSISMPKRLQFSVMHIIIVIPLIKLAQSTGIAEYTD